MTFGSLFAGIGGMDLGLERAGLTCSWQVEIDPFARRVLEKHWPDVRRHGDVRTFPPTDPEDWSVDCIAGGFPCQDLSKAGNVSNGGIGPGLDGARSGLWSEYERIVRLLRPRYVLVENVPTLLDAGLGRVLGALAALGYDAEWECIPAAAVGADHIRDRLFLLAHADGERLRGQGRAAFARPPGGLQGEAREWDGLRTDVRSIREGRPPHGWIAHDWGRRSRVLRVGDGLPGWVDRRRALGNAVVPQVAEWIGRRLMESAK